jgi:Pyruvate:ferredoxin oxidoreductase and related 2-oxoacid:ferredoxin oxidoreductases, gamma subunit
MRVEFRLSGSGGQGLLLAGIVLAEAAIIDDKNAVQTQSYGPEARGGSSKAEVVISDEDIDYPKATDPDYLLALTTEAYLAYGPLMGAYGGSGLIIADASVKLSPELRARTVTVPILETASDKLGKKVVANMVALGVLGGLSKAATRTSLETAVRDRVPKGTEALNLAALSSGFDLAEAAMAQPDFRRKEAASSTAALADARAAKRAARRGESDGRYR